MTAPRQDTRDLSLAEWTRRERERAIWSAVVAGIADGQRSYLDERGQGGQGFAPYRRGGQS